MNRHDTARALDDLAKCDLGHAERTARDWSVIGHTAEGPGQRNSISDPTGSAAVGALLHPDHLPGREPCDACLAKLSAKWRTAELSLRGIGIERGIPTLGLPMAGVCRLLAGNLRSKPASVVLLGRTLRAVNTLRGIVDQTRHMDPKEASEAAGNLAEQARTASYCEACESPVDGDRVVLRSGLCRPGCYELERKREQRGQLEDRTAFINHVRNGVTRGEIVREASPLWRTAVPTYHEGEAS